MFSYFKGVVIALYPTHVVLEVGGIGYAISVAGRTLSEIPAVGEKAQLFTSFVVREQSQALFGFMSSQERDVFEVLLSVTGIGPKMALSLIGHLTLLELCTAVATQDLATLSRVPGVGKKTAERLVVELKDKLAQHAAFATERLAIAIPTAASGQVQDAILALVNLGYHQNAAQKAVKQSLKELPEEPDLATLITASLKNI